MTRTIAFAGDPQVKADLLARLDRHIAAGTLILEDTAWDGISGSPMGVSIEGTDPVTYADAYGYPLPLVTLLDRLASYPVEPFDAIAFVRDWVLAVTPGADLTRAPTLLMLDMLDDPRLRGVNDTVATMLVDLHLRDLEGRPAARSEWSALRQMILALEPLPTNRPLRMAARLWEAAAWPAARGRSTLTDAFAAWRQLQSVFHDPAWNAQDEARKEAILHALWAEHQTAREADEYVDYPGLFEAQDHDLSARYVANLTKTNSYVLGASKTIADRCIALFRAA